MSIGKISGVETGEAVLTIIWDDGYTARINLSHRLATRPMLAPLNDPAEFARAAVSSDGWSVEWPCGIDFGSPQLRRWADEQAGEAMPPAEFRNWIEHHGFTLDTAAKALGLSRRTVAYYLSGEQPVPKTVMLATEGYNHRRAA